MTTSGQIYVLNLKQVTSTRWRARGLSFHLSSKTTNEQLPTDENSSGRALEYNEEAAATQGSTKPKMAP